VLWSGPVAVQFDESPLLTAPLFSRIVSPEDMTLVWKREYLNPGPLHESLLIHQPQAIQVPNKLRLFRIV